MKTFTSSNTIHHHLILTIVTIVLAIVPDGLFAQSCTSCGAGDEVEIAFSASGLERERYKTTNLAISLNGVATPESPISTHTGTVSLRVGEIYQAAVTSLATLSGGGGACYAGVTASFEFAGNGCGRTIRLSTQEPKVVDGQIVYVDSEWKEATTAVASRLADLSGTGSSVETFWIRIQVLEKPGDDGASGADTFFSSSQSSSYIPRSIPRESQDAPPVGGQPVGVTSPGFSSTLSLGVTPMSAGFSSGSLTLAGSISPSLASPSNLRLSNPGVGGLIVVNGAGSIQQVISSVRAVDIQPISGGGFQLRVFNAGSYGPSLDPSDVPYGTISYTPLLADGIHQGGIRVTTSGADQVTRVRDIVSTVANGESWKVTESVGGVVQEVQDFTSFFTYNASGQWERTDMVEITRDGALYSKTDRRYVYQTRREGSPSSVVASHLFLLQETVYENATSPMTTTWEPDPNQIGRARSVFRPDGSWEVYEYYTGTETTTNGDPVDAERSWAGLLKRTLKPWIDGEPATPAAATVGNSESTLIVYDPPTVSDGIRTGHKEVERTTFAPGGSTILKKWAETAPNVRVDLPSLISVLQAAGMPQAWIPTTASIRMDQSTEYAAASSGVSTTTFSYETPHVPDSPWVGSSFGVLDTEGNGSITGYERGTMNNEGVFVPNDPAGAQANWGSDIRSTTVTVSDFGFTTPFEATREVTVRDYRGNPYFTTLSIMDGSGNWSEASSTTYEYPEASIGEDGVPREVITRKDGRTISHRIETLVGDTVKTEEQDENGVETVTIRDSMGRLLSETQKGVEAGTGYDAQPDIVTTYTHSGRTTTTLVSSGGLSRSTTTVEDLVGRITLRTDEFGATISTTYPDGGRETLTTYPGGRSRPLGMTRRETRNIAGRIVSITGTTVIDENYDYEISSGNLVVTKRVGDLESSTRTTITEQDWLGRTISVTTPSPTGIAGETVSTIYSYVPDTNRLETTTTPAGTVRFSKPYPTSNLTYSGLDVNGDGSLSPSGTDRVTETIQSFTFENSYWWQVSSTRTFDVNGSDTSAITSVSKQCVHGNPNEVAGISKTISSSGLTSTVTTLIDPVNKKVTRTEHTNGSDIDAVSISVNGLRVSQSGHDSATPTRWSHNPFGQPVKETSPLGAITRMAYYQDGSLQSTTDHMGKVTGYQYYGPSHPSFGKISVVTNPSQKTVTYAYSDLGQVTEEAGTAAYKVTYEYDEYGARKKMFTWRTATTSDCTEWVYQLGTGLLEQKKDALGRATTYSYYPSGKMRTRTWARNPAIVTTYTYSPLGDLNGITYTVGGASDPNTPDIAFSDANHPHDRLGRPTIVIQNGVGSETLSYFAGREEMDARLYSSDHVFLPDIQIDHTPPDAVGRPTGFTTYSPSGGTQNTVAYSYDTAGRIETVTEGPYQNRSFHYTYRPGSSLVATLTSKLDGNSWFKENRYWDVRGRLIGIRSNRVSGNSVVAKISSHAYDYDALGRRWKNTFQDGSSWEYGYNDRSEVTSAVRKTPAGVAIPQLGAGYDYDGIGNRTLSTSPVLGDHTYTPDSLNQYASITTGNSRTAIGRANSSWNVLVNGIAASRKGDIYYRELTASNGSGPVWQEVVTSKDTAPPAPTTGHLWYAAASVAPAYDFDGNLTNDGRWSYSWDAENRLTQMESTPTATNAGHPYVKVRYAYDWQGRRLARTVYKGSAAAPVFDQSTRWLYDAWNPVIEFNASSEIGGTVVRHNTYTWGLDLSGSLQGAGGVGGLIGFSRLTTDPLTFLSTIDLYAPSYDGNGNIVAWTNSADSAPTSRREYDAFGNAVVMAGTAPCDFGFSTKLQDAETGLYHYGYRFYDPVMGRWPSKDPIEEIGGLNLYGFVFNAPYDWHDDMGGMPGKYTPSFQRNPPGSGTEIASSAGTAASLITGDIFSKGDPVPNYKPGQCRFLITVSGIWMKKNGKDTQNDFRDAVNRLPIFASIPNSVKVNNPSNFGPAVGSDKQTRGLGDIAQILINEIPSLITVADQRLAMQVKGAADAAKRNNCSCWCIYIVAHSQGAMVAKQGLRLVDEETKKHIAFLGMGGETTIGPASGIPAGQIRNIADANDPVRVNGGLGGMSKWNDGPEPEMIYQWRKGEDPSNDGFAGPHSWDKVYLPYLRRHPETLPSCSKKN